MPRSHPSSAVDVILGSFRYCVNERERHRATAAMLPHIVEMMWSRREGDTVYVREYGLLFRPIEVRSQRYRREYDRLADHFVALLED